jgi:hypothetical protein
LQCTPIAIVMEHCVGLFDEDEAKHNVVKLNCRSTVIDGRLSSTGDGGRS